MKINLKSFYLESSFFNRLAFKQLNLCNKVLKNYNKKEIEPLKKNIKNIIFDLKFRYRYFVYAFLQHKVKITNANDLIEKYHKIFFNDRNIMALSEHLKGCTSKECFQKDILKSKQIILNFFLKSLPLSRNIDELMNKKKLYSGYIF